MFVVIVKNIVWDQNHPDFDKLELFEDYRVVIPEGTSWDEAVDLALDYVSENANCLIDSAQVERT